MLSLVLKIIINENMIVVCIGIDRVIGDILGFLVGIIFKNSNFKYFVYGILDNFIYVLNIYEFLDIIKNIYI